MKNWLQIVRWILGMEAEDFDPVVAPHCPQKIILVKDKILEEIISNHRYLQDAASVFPNI
jgi:hypothetical protein